MPLGADTPVTLLVMEFSPSVKLALAPETEAPVLA